MASALLQLRRRSRCASRRGRLWFHQAGAGSRKIATLESRACGARPHRSLGQSLWGGRNAVPWDDQTSANIAAAAYQGRADHQWRLRNAAKQIAALGIEPLLDVIVISSEIGAQKPEPSIFNFALAELGCTAAEAWFVGDHPDQDVRGAEMVGLRAFWVQTGSLRDGDPPGTQLNSLEDLLDHLQPL